MATKPKPEETTPVAPTPEETTPVAPTPVVTTPVERKQGLLAFGLPKEVLETVEKSIANQRKKFKR